jgi:hypothetical protein
MLYILKRLGCVPLDADFGEGEFLHDMLGAFANRMLRLRLTTKGSFSTETVRKIRREILVSTRSRS